MDLPSSSKGAPAYVLQNQQDVIGDDSSGMEENRPPFDSEDSKDLSTPRTPEYPTTGIDLKNLDDDTIRQLVFTSKDLAHGFYLEYGRIMGHDIRIGSSNVKYMLMECSSTINREETKCKCPARLRVAFNAHSNKFHVTDFKSQHNHDLATADNANRLKINRYLSEADKIILRLFRESGFRTYKSVDLLKRVRGQELTFITKDAHNLLYKDTQDLVAIGDAQKALGFLEGLKSSDPGMIYEYEVAEDNTLRMLLFADGFGRDAYRNFNDALVFDSTYKTNRYNMKLVIFSGVDNHLKNCVFAAALLIDETTESYEWALKNFIKIMGGKRPKAVLTDEDASMAAAIEKVLPGVPHRLCSWHLVKNCNKHVKRPKFCNAFGRILKENLSIEEFEEKWQNLIEEHEVSTNRWVVQTYAKREKWAEPFFRGHFMGLMRSTQRAESLNAYFKHEVKSRFSITELLQHFHSVVGRLRSSFLKVQRESELNKPRLKQDVIKKLLKHASQVYTNEVFRLVQTEWLEVGGLVVDFEFRKTDRHFYYSFLDCNYKKGRRWSVEIDLDKDKYLCDCKKLESDGLPCRHIVYFLKNNFFEEIPRSIIYDRWTTEIGKDLRTKFVTVFPKEDPNRILFGDIFEDAVIVCNRADTLTKKAVGKRMLADILRVYDEMDSTESPVEQKPKDAKEVDDTVKPSGISSVRDPQKVNLKGALKDKKQKCGNCGEIGHKAPGCLKKNPNKKTEKQTQPEKRQKTTGKRQEIYSRLDREGSNETQEELNRAEL